MEERIEAVLERPKRSISRPNYRDLSDVRLPRSSRRLPKRVCVQKKDTKLYRLKSLEQDKSKGLVKISYIGYGSEWDEWRNSEDMNESDCASVDASVDSTDDSAIPTTHLASPFPKQPLNLYEQLAINIKSQLMSYRKRSPYCRICMVFDCIYFEGLVLRSSVVPRTKHSKRQVYTLSKISNLNDILGERWYIRGLNSAGDFCYVKPGTVEFYLQYLSGKIDYQLSSDGTLNKSSFGVGYNLVFAFVREDGTLPHWNSVLQLCK